MLKLSSPGCPLEETLQDFAMKNRGGVVVYICISMILPDGNPFCLGWSSGTKSVSESSHPGQPLFQSS